MILFVGSTLLEKQGDVYTYYSRIAEPISSITHQTAIVEGLRRHEDVFILNWMPLGHFPTRTRRPISREVQSENETTLVHSHLPVLNEIVQFVMILRHMVTQISSRKISCSIVYMPFLPRMLAAFVTKLLFPGVPLIVVVPDLVRHSFRGSGKLVTLRKALRIAEDYIVGALSRQVDGFVLLTSDMRDHFAVGVPYLILEAIYPMQPDWESDTSEDETEFVYTYCGKLTRENGVDRLLKAFACLDYSDIRLHICGSGPMESYVQEQAERDSRIVYFGNVSHDRVLAIEKGSTVLVNPRYTYLPNAGLSFPSKLVEYLACGRPVISSRLRGIPSEYDAYLFAIKDDSASALASVMQDVHSKDRSELMQVGAENRRFVRHEKSTSAQGMRLFRFIESVIAISKR